MKERFNMNASTPKEAQDYLEARSKQLLRHGFRKIDLCMNEWGSEMILEKEGEKYQSIYIIDEFRGKSLYPKLVKHKIVTSGICNLEEYLKTKDIDHIVIDLNPTIEYQVISDYYGGNVTKRSGVYLMNHIDEGLCILEEIGASNIAKRSYCVHPIFQSDETLSENFSYNMTIAPLRDPLVLIAAIEYRSVANEYLSTRKIKSIDDIRLSPLKDVNDMLIADKIQNRKDFELYHMGVHPRSLDLDQYFKHWLEKLGVSEEFYQHMKSILS